MTEPEAADLLAAFRHWLTSPCPYDAKPINAERPHPPATGEIVQEAFCEPQWARVTDPFGNGLYFDFMPAPRLHCARCRKDTSRTRILEVVLHEAGKGPGGHMRWAEPILESECPQCGKERHGTVNP